ncbi:hypothetical protein FH063_002307 [Azospirillum argentinense]|uniref:TniQ domain-containing protein n=1 Tax=Azospirillum argentinense TaxID=2970906 RepID=A0A5B0KP57_9PROT|nr:hypothetical protein FH063_002307 [Azospirillum argentinense]
MTVSRLPVVPRPLPDEHLTAWFGRVAGVYSMTSLDLLNHIAEQAGRGPLSGALSHHPAPEPLTVLSRSLGLPVHTLVGLTVPRLRPLWGRAFRTGCTVYPPPLHCPACLAGDEAAGRPHHLRVDWTCALAFHCPVHDIALIPGCPACRHAGLVFHGPPAAARLHCVLCRARLGTRSAESPDRRHHPGHWPAADRRQGPDPQTTHEAPFRAFLNAAMRALAWTPTAGAFSGTGCAVSTRAMLIGLLETLALPTRFGGGHPRRTMLACSVRLPWMRMELPSWLGTDNLLSDFGTLTGPVRFDLLVAVYALLSGAERLISLRRWSPSREDWRVYCLADPLAQLLCAAAPETHAALLNRSKAWAPPLAERFEAAFTAMQDAEDERHRAAARRRDDGVFVPNTEGSPLDHHLLHKFHGLGDHDLLTVDELLALRYAPNTDRGQPVAKRVPPYVITAKAPAQNLPDHNETCPPAPEPSSRLLSPDLFLAAARAAIAVEGPSRAEWTDPKSRRKAWFRMMKEASHQLERLKKEQHPTPAPTDISEHEPAPINPP